jgi:hypothetical protein
MDAQLHGSDRTAHEAVTQYPVAGEGAHLLVVIDHHMARIYKSDLHRSVPQRVIPYDRAGLDRHLHHVEVDGCGRRKPEQGRFYDGIARTLQGAEEVLVFACGTGASSALDALLTALLRLSGDLAGRVAGWIVLDEHHLTEDQLLAEARGFCANRGRRDSRNRC